MTDVITTSQIEPILDDFLGVDCPHYEELRKRCARRIIDLYANSCHSSEWRDISTAPRDGTPLMLGWLGNFHPLVGHCEGDLWGQLNSDFGFEPFPSTPTHWQPLPAPPQRNEVKK